MNNVIRYGGPFTPVEPTVICMYMAQTPYEPYVKPKKDWTDTTNTFKIYSTPDPQLLELLEAVFALQGSTAEIYKLKALAFTIKSKLAEPQQIIAQNGQQKT